MPWREASTTNPETIKKWFICLITGWQQDVNIGIDCGKSGVTVVDVDTKAGKKGRETYEKLDKKHGWPETFTIKTPSGGLHLYYTGGGFRNTQGDHGGLGAGIDTRGEGGFVVGPGSSISDKEYFIFRDRPMAHIPDWLKERLSKHRADMLTPKESGKTIVADQEDDIKSAIEFLKQHEPAIEGHGGDHHTFVTFCMLKERGISCAVAIELAEEHWNPECSPPWEHGDLVMKANSAYKSAHNATGSKTVTADFGKDTVIDFPKPDKKPCTFDAGFDLPRADSLPKRDWIFGSMFQAKQVGMVIAEPGVGKSTWSLSMALSLITNRPLLGIDPKKQCAVGIFNNEDNREEQARRIIAAAQYHNVAAEQFLWPDVTEKGHLLFLNGRERPLRIAKRLDDGRLKAADANELIDYALEHEMRMLIIDPFSMIHPANENDNGEILRIGEILNYVAEKSNAAVVIIHHTRKKDKASSEGHSGNLDSARGASALGGLVRSAYTLDTISPQECKRRGIAEKDRRFYVMLEQAKANMSAPGIDQRLYKRHGEIIGQTADDMDGESIGVLLPVKMEPVVDTGLRVLIEDIENIVIGGAKTIPEITRALIQMPFHLDKQPAALTKTMQRLFSEGMLTGYKGVLHVEERDSNGGRNPSKFIRLDVTNDKPSVSDVI